MLADLYPDWQSVEIRTFWVFCQEEPSVLDLEFGKLAGDVTKVYGDGFVVEVAL